MFRRIIHAIEIALAIGFIVVGIWFARHGHYDTAAIALASALAGRFVTIAIAGAEMVRGLACVLIPFAHFCDC